MDYRGCVSAGAAERAGQCVLPKSLWVHSSGADARDVFGSSFVRSVCERAFAGRKRVRKSHYHPSHRWRVVRWRLRGVCLRCRELANIEIRRNGAVSSAPVESCIERELEVQQMDYLQVAKDSSKTPAFYANRRIKKQKNRRVFY